MIAINNVLQLFVSIIRALGILMMMGGVIGVFLITPVVAFHPNTLEMIQTHGFPKMLTFVAFVAFSYVLTGFVGYKMNKVTLDKLPTVKTVVPTIIWLFRFSLGLYMLIMGVFCLIGSLIVPFTANGDIGTAVIGLVFGSGLVYLGRLLACGRNYDADISVEDLESQDFSSQ